MAYYKSQEHATLFNEFEDFWITATEFVNFEGDYDLTEYPIHINRITNGLCDLINIDPMPVWRAWRGLDRWRKHQQLLSMGRRDPDGFPADSWPIEEIRNLLEDIQLIRSRLDVVCLQDTKPQVDSPAVVKGTQDGVISALRAHHNQAGATVLVLGDLMQLSNASKSTASRAVSKVFGSYNQYIAACDNGNVVSKLENYDGDGRAFGNQDNHFIDQNNAGR